MKIQLSLVALQRHWKLLVWFGLMILVPLAVVGRLALAVRASGGFAFERAWLLALHAHATPGLDRAAIIVTTAGQFRYVALYSAVIFALWLRTRRHAAFLVIAVGGAALLGNVIKLVLLRPRPELWAQLVVETEPSFPSGHATGSMAFAVTMTLLAWKTRARLPTLLVMVPFALLVGLSRLYLGVHYPSDVVAGWLLGAAWSAATWSLSQSRRPTEPAAIGGRRG